MYVASEKRRMTSVEVAAAIKAGREHLNWSQEALAAAANVAPRTLQRAEAGEAGDDTLRRVAKALGVPEDFFVREHVVHTAEDIEAAKKELLDKNWLVPAKWIASGHQLLEFLDGLQAWQYSHDDDISGEAQGDMGTLFDYIADMVQLSGLADMTPSMRLETGNEVTALVSAVERHGLKIFVGAHDVRFKPDAVEAKSMAMRMGYLRVTKGVFEQFIVPKRSRISFA